MQEIELPIENKLKNIIDTENAKKKLLNTKQTKHNLFDIPRNFASDFVKHNVNRMIVLQDNHPINSNQKRQLIAESTQKINIQRANKRQRLLEPQYYLETNQN